MSFIKLKSIASEEAKKDEAARIEAPGEILSHTAPEIPSARAAAESAITEFQNLLLDLTLDQAREAYARLLVGRGFNRPGAAPQAEEAVKVAAKQRESNPDDGRKP